MSKLKCQLALTLIDQIMIIGHMNIDKLSPAPTQKKQPVPQGSAWMRAQCARLQDGYGNKAFSSWLAAIVASLMMFGLQ